MYLSQKHSFLAVLTLLLNSITAFSQNSISTETIRMRQLTVDNGLSQGFVYNGLQDKDGFIWLATMDGLNRYDGYNFTVYKHDPENPYSIPENGINCIAEDERGNFWIGTVSKGLYLMDKTKERFYPVPIASAFNKNNNYNITSIHCRKNLLFLKTAAGMIIVNIGQLTTVNYNLQGLEQQLRVLQSIPLISAFDDISISPGNAFINQSFDNLQVFTQRKPYFEWEEKTLTAIDFGFNSIDVATKFLLLDSINSLLIFHEKNLYLYNLTSRTIVWQQKIDCNDIYKFTSLGNKVYACGYVKNTGNVLFELDVNSKTIKQYHPENDVRVLTPMFRDRTGIIWIRTDAAGLCLFDHKRQAFKTNSYLGRNVIGTKKMIFTRKEETGIFEFLPQNRNFKKILSAEVFKTEKDESLFDFIDHQNRFWRVDPTANPLNSLLSYDTAARQLIRYDFGFKYILILFEDQEKKLWVIHRGGSDLLDIYASRLNKSYTTIERTYHLPVKQVNTDGRFLMGQWEDAKRALWLATDVGLFSLDPSQPDDNKAWRHWKNIPGNNSSLSDNKIISLCPDPLEPQKFLWLGTRGSGLNRFEMATGNVIRFTEKDGLANNVAYDIIPDEPGHLWISTNMGLSCFSLPSKAFPKGHFRNFTEEDGIAGNEFNGLTGKQLNAGELLFHGVKGSTWFNPAEVLQQQDTVPVHFISLSVNNKTLPWQNDSSVINGNISYCKKITLTHDQNIFSIFFSSMDFRNEKGKLYSWKLEGFDKTWTEPSHQHEVTYTNLSPGTYTFRVKPSNADGIWNEQGNSIQIIIIPAWYQTWLFRLAILLLVIGGAYSFYRYRLRQAIKLQEIRNNIASDLHDEIGSTLSSISISSTVIRKKINEDSPEVNNLLSHISTNTDNMMEIMSDIVWAVNTKNDRFENVVNRMRAFAIEILEPAGITLNMHVSSRLDNFTLNMQQRKNLYLVFKEAINNIAKYADCENVRVEIAIRLNKISLKIKDDGKGFSIADAANARTFQPGGNGLNNLQKRAKELNGKITINSAIGRGTEIILEFPV